MSTHDNKRTQPLTLFAQHAQEIAKESLVSFIDSYLAAYAAGKSHTARAKQSDVALFLDFLCTYRSTSKKSDLVVQDWDHSATQSFIEFCLQQGAAPSTVNRRLATIKHMGRTLAEKVGGFINPTREIKQMALPVARPQSLTDAELKNVQDAIIAQITNSSDFVSLRNATLVLLFLATGIRADELRMLTLAQLPPPHEHIKGVRTKGRRFRNVYLPNSFRSVLTHYLQARHQELQKKYGDITSHQSTQHPLFISAYNAKPGHPESFRMGAKSIWRAVRAYTAETKLHPHLLRHTFAHELLESSHDIRLVSQALGHSDVRVTMRYTERREEEIAEAIEKKERKKKVRLS